MGSSWTGFVIQSSHTVFSQAISPQVISYYPTTTQKALLSQVGFISQMNTLVCSTPSKHSHTIYKGQWTASSPLQDFYSWYLCAPRGCRRLSSEPSQTHLFKTGNCQVNKTYIFIRHFLGSQSEVSYMLSVKVSSIGFQSISIWVVQISSIRTTSDHQLWLALPCDLWASLGCFVKCWKYTFLTMGDG